MKKRFLVVIFISVTAKFAAGQNTDAVPQYINTYKNLATNEKCRTDVPTQIKLAQVLR